MLSRHQNDWMRTFGQSIRPVLQLTRGHDIRRLCVGGENLLELLEAEFASRDRFLRAAQLERTRVGHLERGARVAAAVAVVGRREHREHARLVRERVALRSQNAAGSKVASTRIYCILQVILERFENIYENSTVLSIAQSKDSFSK